MFFLPFYSIPLLAPVGHLSGVSLFRNDKRHSFVSPRDFFGKLPEGLPKPLRLVRISEHHPPHARRYGHSTAVHGLSRVCALQAVLSAPQFLDVLHRIYHVFSGGMISSYMLIRSLGLFDTYSVMILPGLVGAYNLVLMRNYFMSLPEEIEESYAGVDRYQRCDRFQRRRQGGDHLCIHPAHPMRLPIYPKILRQRRYGRFLEGMIYSISNADYKEGGFP